MPLACRRDHTNVPIYINICTFIYIYIYIQIYTPTNIHTHIYTYTRTCAYTRICIYTAHCNTLHHTATHCQKSQHGAIHCNTLQHTGGRASNSASTHAQFWQSRGYRPTIRTSQKCHGRARASSHCAGTYTFKQTQINICHLHIYMYILYIYVRAIKHMCQESLRWYEVALVVRIDKMIVLFCKRAL